MIASPKSAYADDSLLTQMDIDVMVNEHGDVCALYDRDLPFAVREIEFYAGSGSLVFKGDGSVSSPLGAPAPRTTRERLAKAAAVHLFRVQLDAEHKFQEHNIVPLIQRN